MDFSKNANTLMDKAMCIHQQGFLRRQKLGQCGTAAVPCIKPSAHILNLLSHTVPTQIDAADGVFDGGSVVDQGLNIRERYGHHFLTKATSAAFMQSPAARSKPGTK
jgi:hypothetical protein